MNGQQCARCNYHGDLAEHAADTSHPLCIVCYRSLPLGHRQTCTHCVGWARRSLIRIEQLYPLLPHELLARAGTAAAMDPSGIRAGHDPLPGGDVMVMLGPGSDGTNQAREIIRATDNQIHQAAPHTADEHNGDTMSILGELERWERDWRHVLNSPHPTDPATVANCALYLLRHLSGAAQEHPEFDKWTDELRQLRRQVEAALNLIPQRSPVPCITCGTRSLEKPAPKDFEWRCTRCHRNYTQDEFYMAMRQHGKAV